MEKVRSFTKAATFLDFRTYRRNGSKDKKTGNYSADE